MFQVLTMLTLLTVAQSPSPWPLDQELKSSFSGSKVSVEMACKVVKTEDIYTYMYSVKNTGKKAIKIKWDLIGQAIHFGNDLEMLIDLEPDENIVVTLQHPDPPFQTFGKATAFYLTNEEKIGKMLAQTPQVPKGMKIEVSKKIFYESHSGRGHGALPKSFLGIK